MSSTWADVAKIAVAIVFLAIGRAIRAGDRTAALDGRVPLSRRAKLQYSIYFLPAIVLGLAGLMWGR